MKHTPEPDEPEGGTIGVDLGLVNLATGSEGEAFSGEAVEKNRQRMSSLRQRLQKRGTKSAKRHLKKLSGRESRFKKTPTMSSPNELFKRPSTIDKLLLLKS